MTLLIFLSGLAAKRTRTKACLELCTIDSETWTSSHPRLWGFIKFYVEYFNSGHLSLELDEKAVNSRLKCLIYYTVMEPKELLQRFDTRSRLLLRALFLGSAGVYKALKVFNRQRTLDTSFSVHNLLEILCQGEPCLHRDTQGLTT